MEIRTGLYGRHHYLLKAPGSARTKFKWSHRSTLKIDCNPRVEGMALGIPDLGGSRPCRKGRLDEGLTNVGGHLELEIPRRTSVPVDPKGMWFRNLNLNQRLPRKILRLAKYQCYAAWSHEWYRQHGVCQKPAINFYLYLFVILWIYVFFSKKLHSSPFQTIITCIDSKLLSSRV